MKSIRDIYKIGKGPSSSHTMGPERAAKLFRSNYPDADEFRVVLYGSLSKTGIGHGTDRVIREVLSPLPARIIFSQETLTTPIPTHWIFSLSKKAKRSVFCESNPLAAVISVSQAVPARTTRKSTLSTPLRKSPISVSGAILTNSVIM